MKIYLAPMEGLTDFYMRDILTGIGGYDACVTEFIRVTDRLLPERVFLQACPELRMQGKTRAGTPVHVQLLGSEPSVLAENAAFAAELGAPEIDLNFGCPAKTVNRHRGGAILLEEPETVHAIVAAVRRAVPETIPVTAKMRLGVKDRCRMLDNARAIAAAGASSLVVHARTKVDGYRPPAHWEAIAEIRRTVKLPVMANGEIWTAEDAKRCRQASHCGDLMLGRGAVTNPALACQIRGEDFRPAWSGIVVWQQQFLTALQRAGKPEHPVAHGSNWTERGAIGRYKQWLAMLAQAWPEARTLFDTIKKLQHFSEVQAALAASSPPSRAA
ncbi:MAG: tRNA dihydrouridine synthase [Pseudomonadota bacterium]